MSLWCTRSDNHCSFGLSRLFLCCTYHHPRVCKNDWTVSKKNTFDWTVSKDTPGVSQVKKKLLTSYNKLAKKCKPLSWLWLLLLLQKKPAQGDKQVGQTVKTIIFLVDACCFIYLPNQNACRCSGGQRRKRKWQNSNLRTFKPVLFIFTNENSYGGKYTTEPKQDCKS